jgi:hypothetical protein
MPLGIGYASYVSYIQQAAFGTVGTPTVTAAHLRSGEIFSPRQTKNPRVTTTSVMPKASQTWTTMGLVDVNAEFEFVGTGSHAEFNPILQAAFGKRLRAAAAADFTHTYTVNNPPVDGGTDGTPAGAFYNHALTMRQTVHDGTNAVATYVVQDICISRFTMTMEANALLRFGVQGVGQKMAASTATAFSDITGTTFSWIHAIAGANSGLYVGAANPPTTAVLVKRATFTLDNNLRFEPFLGAASGLELKLPTRNGFPTARLDLEMDFEDTAGTDAVVLMTDYLAGTDQNISIKYYVGAANYVSLLASAATKPAIINNPRPVVNADGPVGFTVGFDIYPEAAATDLTLVVMSDT